MFRLAIPRIEQRPRPAGRKVEHLCTCSYIQVDRCTKIYLLFYMMRKPGRSYHFGAIQCKHTLSVSEAIARLGVSGFQVKASELCIEGEYRSVYNRLRGVSVGGGCMDTRSS